MVKDLLPIGTTNTYIDFLTKKEIQPTLFAELRDNYSRLTFNEETRANFLRALVAASSNFAREGWIFRTERVTELTTEALKTLKDFLLIDTHLMQNLNKRPHQVVGLKLDKHLQDESSRAVALELIEFLTKSKTLVLQDYVGYVLTPEGRELVTKYLQKKDSEEKEKSKKRVLESDSEEDDGGEGSSSKSVKVEDAIWSWQEDDHTWVDYSDDLSAKLEKAYKKKQKTAKVDKQRFVDFENMLQRRYDDTTKRRAIKRELKSDILE
eukprot:TRINITY_DN4477_c0_g2_i3.p1 TRINITY_DN4477_c0_g2~~TRINITY_DN4477_c0_g2_i3.p1  ORF type:complete len:266 (+),score=62.18 TRINITY_DN4477_c0_g2_i3:365-1162(+)